MQNPFSRSDSYPVPDTATVRDVMQKVYLWMSLALMVTAITAIGMVSTGLVDSLAETPILFFGLFLVELGVVVWISSRIHAMAVGQAFSLFFLYAILNGITLSIIFLAYTEGSIVGAFVASSAMFGAMSIIGVTTSMDLSKFGSILFMAIIGLIVATVVNLFLASSAINFLISAAGVVIFSGLTAYDTQYIQRMAARVGSDPDNIMRVSIMGALKLYLDFINLFLYLLRLVGKRR